MSVEDVPNKTAGRIHVAGVIDRREAELLVENGVRRIGLPFALDHHREDLSLDAARAIVAGLGGRARFFLITYLATAEGIVELCRRLGVEMVQIHGPIEAEQLRDLRRRAPELHVLKSLIVRTDCAAQIGREIERTQPFVDGFITDSFDPATGASGATGRTHDWRISRRAVELARRPVILAGGLDPVNVTGAVRFVRPAGVDVHTGVEGPDGRKDPRLVRAFVTAARAGFDAWPPDGV